VHHRGASDEADEVVRLIRAMGRNAVAVAADLTQPHETASLVARAAAAIGPLHLLVNNASLFEADRFGALDLALWDRHFETNLRAPVLLAQAFAAQAPAALEDGQAMILNILDQRVLHPNPQFFSYTLSKSALFTATRTMAQALAPRIRVNAIGPGPTLASIHQDASSFAAEAEATPLARAVAPQDICAAALYLLGARTVTGQMLAVDAGQHLAWRTPDIVEP
jgi:NAD(P)-dependent dehydrogenase (short-subunit alcohol dehydrogenase family)